VTEASVLYFDTSAFKANTTSVIGHLSRLVAQIELVEFVKVEQSWVPDGQLLLTGRVTLTYWPALPYPQTMTPFMLF